MIAQQYAEALYRATQGKDGTTIDEIVARLVSYMKERGHASLLPRVAREFEILEKRRGHTTRTSVFVARNEDVELYAETIENDIETLGLSTAPRQVFVDDTLIGGYEVRGNGVRIDRTHKRSLVTLYNTLLANT